MNLNNYKTVEGVHLLSEFRNDFENAYTKIRDYEGRILSIEEIKKLPFPGNQSQKVKEWKLRANTAIKFRNYIKGQSDKKVLDVGCGNGWFSHFIHSSLINSQVIGLMLIFRSVTLKTGTWRVTFLASIRVFDISKSTTPPYGDIYNKSMLKLTNRLR